MLMTFLRRLFSRDSADLLPEGSKAPPFRVRDQRGEWVDSATFAGQRAVLWFYPKAATPG